MKDKLIELICSVKYGKGSLVGKNFKIEFIEKIADHLIANGVTLETDNNVGCKKLITNADRIRTMSDEELAKFLDDNNSQGCVYPARDCRATCMDCIADWLKQPAEEDA